MRGSPPLARELRFAGLIILVILRITPARAGTTRGSNTTRKHWRDHPRSRGNYVDYKPGGAVLAGSPPLARELLNEENILAFVLGITPARAGTTYNHHLICEFRQDHPRSRGNYPSHFFSSSPGLGSPPLARELQK